MMITEGISSKADAEGHLLRWWTWKRK